MGKCGFVINDMWGDFNALNGHKGNLTDCFITNWDINGCQIRLKIINLIS